MPVWRADIPTVNITQDQVDANLQCSICLEDFKVPEPVRRLNCLHVYHENCIAPWLDRSNICPTCRRLTVDEEEVDFWTDIDETSDLDMSESEILMDMEEAFLGSVSDGSDDWFDEDSESEESIFETMSDHSVGDTQNDADDSSSSEEVHSDGELSPNLGFIYDMEEENDSSYNEEASFDSDNDDDVLRHSITVDSD